MNRYACFCRRSASWMVDALEQRVFLSASPAVQWTMYLGGEAEDRANAVAVDSAGNILVAGYTKSSDVDGATDPKVSLGAEGFDGFLEKLDGSGKVLWTRYLRADVQASAIAIDHDDNIWVTGSISSQSRLLPNSNTMPPGWSEYVDEDVFVAKFNSDGEAQWATYLGGSDWDFATCIAIDDNGDALVAGYTPSPDFVRATNKLAMGEVAPEDGFVAKITAAGSLDWATYVGGDGSDAVESITIDKTGEITVAGRTNSREFAESTNGYSGGDADGFVARLGRCGELLWTTYLGSDGDDSATGVVSDGYGNLYVAGHSTDQSTAGGSAAFVSKLTSSGSPLWTTSLPFLTTASALALDSASNALVTGYSYSSATLSDCYVMKVNPSGVVDWSLSIGGAGSDQPRAIAVDRQGAIYLAGITSSTDSLPLANNSYHGTRATDGFVAAISARAETNAVGSYAADAIHISSSAVEMDGEVRQGVRLTINGIAGGSFVPNGPLMVDGLSGDDTVTVDPDVHFPVIIHGGAGNDTITGGSGDDLLYGDDGNDVITGGGGNDTLYGNFGSDTLSGGTGDDQLFAGLGPDLLNGGDGDDTLLGGNGMDQIRGGAGADSLDGKGKADSLSGGAGNDTITSGAGSDYIAGDDGDDTLYANPNQAFRDTLIGGAGHDLYIAGPDDVLQDIEEPLLT